MHTLSLPLDFLATTTLETHGVGSVTLAKIPSFTSLSNSFSRSLFIAIGTLRVHELLVLH